MAAAALPLRYAFIGAILPLRWLSPALISWLALLAAARYHQMPATLLMLYRTSAIDFPRERTLSRLRLAENIDRRFAICQATMILSSIYRALLRIIYYLSAAHYSDHVGVLDRRR
jgi:hypothetical protein